MNPAKVPRILKRVIHLSPLRRIALPPGAEDVKMFRLTLIVGAYCLCSQGGNRQVEHRMTFAGRVPDYVMRREENSNRSSFCLGAYQFKLPSATSDANSEFGPRLTIESELSRYSNSTRSVSGWPTIRPGSRGELIPVHAAGHLTLTCDPADHVSRSNSRRIRTAELP